MPDGAGGVPTSVRTRRARACRQAGGVYAGLFGRSNVLIPAQGPESRPSHRHSARADASRTRPGSPADSRSFATSNINGAAAAQDRAQPGWRTRRSFRLLRTIRIPPEGTAPSGAPARRSPPSRITRPWKPSSTSSRTPPRASRIATPSGCGWTTARPGTGRMPRSCAAAGSRRGGCGRSGCTRAIASSPGPRRRPRCPPPTSARCTRASCSSRSTPAWRPDTVGRIVDRSGAVRLLLGSGRDAPDPREVELERLPDVDRRGPLRRARRHVPARLGGAARGLAAPEARRHLRARVHARARPATPRA